MLATFIILLSLFLIFIWSAIGAVTWVMIRLFYPEFREVSFASSIISGMLLAVDLGLEAPLICAVRHDESFKKDRL